MPDSYAPLLNFVKFTAGECKLFQNLVSYLCILLSVLNKYFLIVDRSNEYIY
jgi:hypothetical protein